MKIKSAVIVFPGTTGAKDLKEACDYFEWDTDLIWHKDNILKKYDIVFLPSGFPYGETEYSAEELKNKSAIINRLPVKNSLLVGLSDGFKILCELNLLNGKMDFNSDKSFYSGIKEFSFLDNNVNLHIATYNGNFIKNTDFNEDVILKYKNADNISENKIAGVFDYENKIIGLIANPELSVKPHLKHFDGRKVFEFLKNVI